MTNIYYEHINNHLTSSLSIVFLHEGLGCTKTWRDFPQLLCNRLSVQGIVYDRPGYGKSIGNLFNRTNNYLIEAADELNYFLKDIGTNKVILYGHSDGGSIALAFAAKYPQKTLALIAEAAHVENEPETRAGIRMAVNAYKKGKFSKLKLWHGENLDMVFNAWAHTWLKDDFDLLTLKELLPKVLAPQLIIQGMKDQYGTAKQYQTIKNLTSGPSQLLILDCKHTPFLENQFEVLEASENFIKLIINGNYKI